jgi:predicted CopG family antitoxin
MTDEQTKPLIRKNIQVSVEVYDTLTNLKRGNETYTDVMYKVFEKAKIPLVLK